MKPVFFGSVLLFLAVQIWADQWTAQTSGTTNNLYSVSFPGGSDTGYVTGAGGTMLRTVNGGATWTPLVSGTTQPLYSVSSPANKPNDTIYAAGGNGVILKTVNRGTNWTAQTSGTTQTFRFIVFYGPYGTAGGGSGSGSGVGSNTSNGGATWQTSTAGTTLYSMAISNTTAGNVLLAHSMGISKSTDGLTFTSPLTTTYPLYSLQWVGSLAFAVGDLGLMYKSTNNGDNWSSVTSGVTQSLNSTTLFDSSGAFASTGYIAGAGGTLLKTTNTGATWISQTGITTQTLNAIVIPHYSKNFVYAVGNGGLILKGTVGATPVLKAERSPGPQMGITLGGKLWYNLPAASNVEAMLVDPQGRLAWKAAATQQSAGYHEMHFPNRLFSRMSFLEFRAGGFHRVVKLGR